MKQRDRAAALAGVVLGLAVLLSSATPAAAMRIVSLAPSVTETLFALGAGGEVVGVSTYCDYPPEAAKIDKVGTFLAPSEEVILAKRPDLVIAVPSPGNRNTVLALERLGLEVLVVDPATIEGTRHSIEAIGSAIGHEREATALIARLDGEIAMVRDKLAKASRPRVLMVVGHTPLVAVGRGNYLDELIGMAGGTNIAASAGGEWPHLSLELVLAQAPEVIIDTSMGTEEAAGEGGAFWRELTTLPAVRDGKVYSYRDDTLLRPGPRFTSALVRLAHLIHPEIEIDLAAPPPAAPAAVSPTAVSPAAVSQ